jgi:predicted GIY-YIG superfamily endonuclease
MMCMKIVDDKSTYLYRCYDRHAVLLYVGITVNPDQRMRSHTFDKFWWGDVVKTTYMAFKTREQALWAEWAVITTCHPLYNVMSQIPPEHRCPDQPLAIDGYISIIKSLHEVESNTDARAALDQKMRDRFVEAGIGDQVAEWPTTQAFSFPSLPWASQRSTSDSA